jgi:hypothetical protein
MAFKIDGTLYPDTQPPVELNRLAERVDFGETVRSLGFRPVT